MMIRCFLVLSLLISEINAQKPLDPLVVLGDELEQKMWVDSIYSSMTIKEKVGQLFVVQAFSNKNKNHKVDIIYFDAFGPRVQPELWTEEIFKLMYTALKPNGILVTYSVKGTVKRALRSVGFELKRLEGPPNKRHMLRAIKR